MALNQYVDVTISLQADTVSREGFGTLLFITEDVTAGAGFMSPTYGNIEELEQDFASGTEPYKAGIAAFSQGNGFSQMRVFSKTGPWADAVSEALAVNSDFYAVAIESRDDADILAVAGEVQARQKLLLACSEDLDNADDLATGTVSEDLLDLGLYRTGLIVTADGSDYPEVAWAGRMLPEDPGTDNWAYKALAGISTDNFTSGEISTLRERRASYYTREHGVNITFAGQTSDGGWYIDFVRGLDWIRVRLAERYLGRQASGPAIPYMNPGPAIIEQLVRTQLDIAVDRGIITPDYDVFVPRALNQDSNDRANRHFPGVTFKIIMTGFLNTLEIRGTAVV